MAMAARKPAPKPRNSSLTQSWRSGRACRSQAGCESDANDDPNAGGEVGERREKVFSLFSRLFERRDQIAGYMSGGEQQMLAIGRALMTDPVLLALVERSLGLAPLIIDRIYEVIAKLRDQMKMTVLLVEQNAQRAVDIADDGSIHVTGRVVLDGSAKTLAANADVQEFYLGVSNSGRKSLRDVKHYKRRKRWLS